jgi:hypothetical protein
MNELKTLKDLKEEIKNKGDLNSTFRYEAEGYVNTYLNQLRREIINWIKFDMEKLELSEKEKQWLINHAKPFKGPEIFAKLILMKIFNISEEAIK